MGMPLERQTPNEPVRGESSSKEMLKLVHKLRWAGMDEEAERLLKTVATRADACRKTKSSRPRPRPTSAFPPLDPFQAGVRNRFSIESIGALAFGRA